MSISSEVNTLLSGYLGWYEKATDALTAEEEYEEVRKEAREWRQNEALVLQTEIEMMIRKALGLLGDAR